MKNSTKASLNLHDGRCLDLQLLLENCIKHNSLPLSIVVDIKEGYIEVINNLNTRQVVQKGTQLGLSSIRRRYELISNRSVNIEKSNNYRNTGMPQKATVGNTFTFRS